MRAIRPSPQLEILDDVYGQSPWTLEQVLRISVKLKIQAALAL